MIDSNEKAFRGLQNETNEVNRLSILKARGKSHALLHTPNKTGERVLESKRKRKYRE